jgi:hypothetical protein
MSSPKRTHATDRAASPHEDALVARPDVPPLPAEPTSDDLLRYAGDPLAFAREVLGAEPWAAQQRILLSLRDHPRTTVRSSHGVGKTWTAACAALWWVYSHRPSLMISTAPTARQVESLLWAEINRLWQREHSPQPGRCLRTRLRGDRCSGVRAGNVNRELVFVFVGPRSPEHLDT